MDALAIGITKGIKEIGLFTEANEQRAIDVINLKISRVGA